MKKLYLALLAFNCCFTCVGAVDFINLYVPYTSEYMSCLVNGSRPLVTDKLALLTATGYSKGSIYYSSKCVDSSHFFDIVTDTKWYDVIGFSPRYYVNRGFIRIGGERLYIDKTVDVTSLFQDSSGIKYIKLDLLFDNGNPKLKIIIDDQEEEISTMTEKQMLLYKIAWGKIEVDYRKIATIPAYGE